MLIAEQFDADGLVCYPNERAHGAVDEVQCCIAGIVINKGSSKTCDHNNQLCHVEGSLAAKVITQQPTQK